MSVFKSDLETDALKRRASENFANEKAKWLMANGLNPKMTNQEFSDLIKAKTGRSFPTVSLRQYMSGDRFSLAFFALMADMMDISVSQLVLTEEQQQVERMRVLKGFTPVIDFKTKRMLMNIRTDILRLFSVESKMHVYGLVLEPHINQTAHADGALALIDVDNLQVTKGHVLIKSADNLIVCEVGLNKELALVFKLRDGTTIPFDHNLVKGRVFHMLAP